MADFEDLTIDKDSPIGVFDSGMGGITVLKDLVRELPNEDFIFFGDSIHAPYGEKGPEQIRKFSIDAAHRLMNLGVKAIVIACNTATSAAASYLREEYPDFSIIGIEPALKPAVTAHPGGRIVVMATPATLKLPKFMALLDQYKDQAEVSLLPVHGLVELIEQGTTDGPEVDELLKAQFDTLGGGRIDAVVLGCTHFPHAAGAISRAAGPSAELFDGGPGTARHLKEVLAERDELSKRTREGAVTFLNSIDGTDILDQMSRLFRS